MGVLTNRETLETCSGRRVCSLLGTSSDNKVSVEVERTPEARESVADVG